MSFLLSKSWAFRKRLQVAEAQHKRIQFIFPPFQSAESERSVSKPSFISSYKYPHTRTQYNHTQTNQPLQQTNKAFSHTLSLSLLSFSL